MSVEARQVAESLISGSRIHKSAIESLPFRNGAIEEALKAKGFELVLDADGHYDAKKAAPVPAENKSEHQD